VYLVVARQDAAPVPVSSEVPGYCTLWLQATRLLYLVAAMQEAVVPGREVAPGWPTVPVSGQSPCCCTWYPVARHQAAVPGSD